MKSHSLRIYAVLFGVAVCSSYAQAVSLTAATTNIGLTCTKGSTCNSSGTSTLAISSGTGYFTVTAPSVPWVLVTPMTGTADTTAGDTVLTFSVSPAWTTLGSGLYTTTVTIASLGVTSATVTVQLQVNDATPTLTIKGSINSLNPVPYVAGGAAPPLSLTVLSSDGLAVAFTAVAASSVTPEGITSWLSPASQTGIAYSWGTTLSFTASAPALAEAQAGDLLMATVTITPSNGNPIIVPVSISVGAPVATITAVTPNAVPLLSAGVAPGSVTLVVKGTSFISTTGAQKTKVFVNGIQVLTDNVTVLSPNYLTLAIPYDSTGGVFKTAGATAVAIGVANGAAPTAPVGATVAVAVTSAPIISTITSGSTFVEPVGTANPKVAPYDIVSIFGTNLCALCTGSNSVLVGAPDTTYYRFPAFLAPDASAASPHKITVIFSKPAASPAVTLPGYLLFATSTQINVLVPGAISTLAVSGVVDVQVAYDTVTPPAAANTSVLFPVSYVATDPGIFTISSNGQGSGAITNASTFALNTMAVPNAPADIVSIFVTGLGIPTSSGTNVATTGAVYGTDCLAALGSAGTNAAAPTGYLGTVLTPATVTTGPWVPGASYVVPNPVWTSIDGAVMQSALLQGNFAPCFPTASVPTVTIGGVTATVSYAGFVAGSIAGLYQINVAVPTPTDLPTYSAGTPAQYKVIVTMPAGGTVTSQANVTMWVD